MNMIQRVTQITVVPEGEAIFSEQATTITIEDEAGGEFIVLKSNLERDDVAIDPKEWPVLRAAIDRMIEECRA